MIIYLEGPDGSGKSTLIDYLTDALISSGYEVDDRANRFIPTHPLAKYRPDGVERITEDGLYKQLAIMNKSSKIYIIDRGPISDIIYRFFDDYQPVTAIDTLIQEFKKLNNLLTIYCHNSKAEEMMLKRGDDNPIAITKHKEISKLYNDIFTLLKAHKDKIYDYDFTKENALNEILGNIVYTVALNLSKEK